MSIELLVSATTPNYRPTRSETVARVAMTFARIDAIRDILELDPVLGYWQGTPEHSVRVKLAPHIGLAQAVRLATFARANLDQEAVLVVADKGHRSSPVGGFTRSLRLGSTAKNADILGDSYTVDYDGQAWTYVPQDSHDITVGYRTCLVTS